MSEARRGTRIEVALEADSDVRLDSFVASTAGISRTQAATLIANGHVMVTPYDHVGDLRGLGKEASAELMELTRRSLDAVERVYGPQGFNVGANLGEAAGAGFADHVHMHVVPRWKGDTNFMPVVGDTRVMPEALLDSWEKLRAAFAEGSS